MEKIVLFLRDLYYKMLVVVTKNFGLYLTKVY